MNTRLKFFTLSLLFSMPFWWGFNVLAENSEKVFFNFITQNQQTFKAAVSSAFEDITRKNNFGELEINAKAGASVLILEDNSQAFLFKKNINQPLPIASLTKLMAADVALENFDIFQKVKFGPEVFKEGNSNFKIGESFYMKDLLCSGLIESNNSAIKAIAETIGEKAFVDLMNLEAKYLGMSQTHFFNSTGLDPKDSEPELINLSTVQDLTKLVKHILKKSLILEIMGQKEFALYTFEGNFHHKVITTNEFLKANVSFGNKEIIGGKTGQTKRAGGSLILILKLPQKNRFLINIVLGSEDRFGDTEKIINWVSKTYEI